VSQGIGKIGWRHRGWLAYLVQRNVSLPRHRRRVVISSTVRYHVSAMATFLTVLLVLAMLGVLGVLGFGVATMLRGGNPRLSNKLMQGRVVMQAVALLLLALLMMMAAGRH
jgi:NADH:ubiquinone oxidoreductase subunit 6 (subunit J)